MVLTYAIKNYRSVIVYIRVLQKSGTYRILGEGERERGREKRDRFMGIHLCCYWRPRNSIIFCLNTGKRGQLAMSFNVSKKT